MWVLVRYEGIPNMFVLRRRDWEVYVAAGKQAGHITSVKVAESNDKAELERFRALTEES
jgi:hypothetical protein